MDQQVPSSVPPTAEGLSPSLTPEQVEEMKRIAKERAIQQMLAQNGPVARTPMGREVVSLCFLRNEFLLS